MASTCCTLNDSADFEDSALIRLIVASNSAVARWCCCRTSSETDGDTAAAAAAAAGTAGTAGTADADADAAPVVPAATSS